MIFTFFHYITNTFFCPAPHLHEVYTGCKCLRWRMSPSREVIDGVVICGPHYDDASVRHTHSNVRQQRFIIFTRFLPAGLCVC